MLYKNHPAQRCDFRTSTREQAVKGTVVIATHVRLLLHVIMDKLRLRIGKESALKLRLELLVAVLPQFVRRIEPQRVQLPGRLAVHYAQGDIEVLSPADDLFPGRRAALQTETSYSDATLSVAMVMIVWPS